MLDEQMTGPSVRRARRRALLLAAAGSLAGAFSSLVRGQTRKPIVIGWLSTHAHDPTGRDLPNFKEALAAFGRRDGVDVQIEARSS